MNIESQLRLLQEKYAQLCEENKCLKQRLAAYEPISDSPITTKISQLSSSRDKIRLYLSLFKGRTDVYAKRWQSKNGRSGYSLVCANEWKNPICKKPAVKCSECKNSELVPVTEQTISEHLRGESLIGIYPF